MRVRVSAHGGRRGVGKEKKKNITITKARRFSSGALSKSDHRFLCAHKLTATCATANNVPTVAGLVLHTQNIFFFSFFFSKCLSK